MPVVMKYIFATKQALPVLISNLYNKKIRDSDREIMNKKIS